MADVLASTSSLGKDSWGEWEGIETDNDLNIGVSTSPPLDESDPVFISEEKTAGRTWNAFVDSEPKRTSNDGWWTTTVTTNHYTNDTEDSNWAVFTRDDHTTTTAGSQGERNASLVTTTLKTCFPIPATESSVLIERSQPIATLQDSIANSR